MVFLPYVYRLSLPYMTDSLFTQAFSPETLDMNVLSSQSPMRFIPHGMRLQDLVNSYNKSDAVGIFFCGAIALLVFFILLLLVKNKEKIYLHYGLFLFFMLIYGFIHIEASAHFSDRLIGLSKRLVEPVTILSFSFYIFFTLRLMEIKAQSRALYRLLTIWGYVLIVYAVSYYAFYHFIFDFEHRVFLTARALIFPLSLICLLWVSLGIKSPVKGYFITGSVVYFVGALVATVRYTVPGLPFPGFYQFTAPVYFEIGIMIETLCFALALGHRIYHVHYEKQLANEKLIHQLSLNERITKNMNEQLEREVEERTKEILNTQLQLQEQETKRLQAEYYKDLAQAEILTRRLQINPHFLFNCLNSIQYLIHSDQNPKASKYLLNFSRFIRMVLDTSNLSVISLAQELEIIQSYMELERNRFDQDFSYRIKEGSDTDLQQVFVPPLLLQPFVENAIWHGLLPSTRERKIIQVDITDTPNGVSVSIDDNGVGRTCAREASTPRLYKSLGISLTKERIRLHNLHYAENLLSFRIIDKKEEAQNPLGTRVEIAIQTTTQPHENSNY